MKATMESLNATWNAAFNSGNAAAVAALYTEQATLSPGNGQTLIGRSAIEQLFKSFIDSGVHQHSIEVIDAYGNDVLVYQVAKWNAYGAEVDGSSPSFGGILMSVAEKDATGVWKTRSHVWNVAG
jgi:uncharacterized protein (TIGR02246 family)